MTSRRQFLLRSAGLVFVGGLPVPAEAFRIPLSSPLTPAQMEGPFYPDAWERLSVHLWEADNDLCRHGDEPTPPGRQLYLLGRVVRPNGRPVANARVELWNATNEGKYLMEWDGGALAPHDPRFQHFGYCDTDGSGRYAFRTIIPPSYPADTTGTWFRPPHLHVKILVAGWERLTTQVYFDDPEDPENESQHAAFQDEDRLLRTLRAEHRARLIATVRPVPANPPPAFEDELRALDLVFFEHQADGPWGRARTGRLDFCIPSSGGMKPPRRTPAPG